MKNETVIDINNLWAHTIKVQIVSYCNIKIQMLFHLQFIDKIISFAIYKVRLKKLSFK